jgi:replication factor C small subunit
MKEVWTEKYRPKKLADVMGQTEITERLKAYVSSGNLPHLLFAGPAGTGKTTSAIALARELYRDVWQQNFHELNASDERGIVVVRTKIKEFARTQPIGEMPFKIIFLDEADALTPEAQAALRRTMEKFSGTCRFILSCNYSSKIIEPIQSRCAVFRFRALLEEDIKKYMAWVAEQESLTITEDGYSALLYVARGDMRKAINALQVGATLDSKITDEILYKSTATARPEDVQELLKVALTGDFIKSREHLDNLLINYGLSGEDIIRQIHHEVFNLDIPEITKVELVDKIGEVEFRLVEGSNERIQLESLIAHFVFLGSKLK